ncbi:MAG: tRNA uridine-5-carboxymethylaminomethyl(34) synthesis enzyme MnmG [Verrucomicrobia bacterium]|nr:tRNA uridine-5-carboxymethylaminomethyl(34) synthesis enzyme MnmG [Verrucomicrobiota bacterium]
MVWKYPEEYDVIVIGGGHAGCEAAFAAAKRGVKTLLLTMNITTIAQMSCNPSVGGIGKGHMVREIDALGGLMAKAIEATGIQFRMLNTKKGPAVQAPRAQADKDAYRVDVRQRLEKTANLDIKQATCEELIIENNVIVGVISKEGLAYHGKTVIITSGTFMRGLIHMGDVNMTGGRAGDPPSIGLSASLERSGIKLGRLKTGTPVRIHKRSIDFSLTEEQPGDEGVRFSFDPRETQEMPQVPCHITYTTLETKAIIQANIHRSPMYSGKIVGVGPRYCPSIEDKVVRFSDKDRHQIFLEPEGLTTEEIYVNGVSSSLPFEVQYAFIRSIPSLRNAEIMRPGYAIEYDYVVSGQINFSLESTHISGLFFAGQINGTTGYEEAAAQGLIAGINAVQKVLNKAPVILSRAQAYIGVMIDDLVTKGVDEPYRMFTSRAEHRLLLRHDNADLRLRRLGHELGMISDEQLMRLAAKEEAINRETTRLGTIHKPYEGKNCSLAQLLARPEMTYEDLCQQFPEQMQDYGHETNRQIELTVKYAGYIGRQEGEVEKLSHVESIRVPQEFDFNKVVGLRTEARIRLTKVRPTNLGQASRVPGIAPADISVLMIALARREDDEFSCSSCSCA